MRICSACEHEYSEDLNFCGKCGHAFGGPQLADENERMNQHLRQLSASAEKERRMEARKEYTADRVFGQEVEV